MIEPLELLLLSVVVGSVGCAVADDCALVLLVLLQLLWMACQKPVLWLLVVSVAATGTTVASWCCCQCLFCCDCCECCLPGCYCESFTVASTVVGSGTVDLMFDRGD